MVRRGRRKEIPTVTKDQLLKGVIGYLAEKDERFLDKLIMWSRFDEEIEARQQKLDNLRALENPTRGQKVAMSKLQKQLNYLRNLQRLVNSAFES